MTSLSQSELWSQMKDYYEQLGVEVWQDEVVPLDITSNVYLANLYARLIIAGINDYKASGNAKADEPFYIFELGAGHGKFSFYLLKRLLQGLSIYELPNNSIRYVMTDISPKDLEAWQANKAFKPYIEQGVLDFALYNTLEDSEVALTIAKQTIGKQTLHNPIFVIANYLFDSLPHDAFQIVDGKLSEAELKIKHNRDSADVRSIKDIFENADFDFTYNPIEGDYYPEHVELNQVLKQYEDIFLEASFTLPIGGVNCIENIEKLTTSTMMLLVADKAVANSDFFEGIENPDITIHGSVSMTVNIDALSLYTENKKGKALLMDNQNADFQVACLIYNQTYPVHQTQYAFKSSLSAFSPQDMYSLCYCGEDDQPNDSLESLDEILALLNLAQWDPNIFFDYHDKLLELLEQEPATLEQEAGLYNGAKKVWDYFFHLEKNRDIPFALGCILYEIDEFEEAVFYFNQSLEYFGEQAETYLNLALAYQNLEENNKAIEAAKMTLSFNPNQEEAQTIINELLPN